MTELTANLNLKLRRNRVKCLACGKIIESFDRHDYKTCGCPNDTMVDGGLEYERYGGVDMTLIETMFEYVDKDEFLWGVMTPDGPVRKPLSEIDNDHLQNIALHLRKRYSLDRYTPEAIDNASDADLDYLMARFRGDKVIQKDHILPELEKRGLPEVTEEIPWRGV
jgi:hypothetical protein